MIQVTKILGESFDLLTKKELPKALVLSNGIREFSLHVDDETARTVVEMLLENEAAAPVQAKRSSSFTPEYVQEEYPQTVARPQKAAPAVPEMELADEDGLGLEPGEEYNDPATGAESL